MFARARLPSHDSGDNKRALKRLADQERHRSTSSLAAVASCFSAAFSASNWAILASAVDNDDEDDDDEDDDDDDEDEDGTGSDSSDNGSGTECTGEFSSVAESRRRGNTGRSEVAAELSLIERPLLPLSKLPLPLPLPLLLPPLPLLLLFQGPPLRLESD